MIKDAINFDILRLLRVEVSLPRQICQTNTVIVWKVYESHIRAKSKVDSFSRMEWQVHFAVGDPPVMS